VLGVEPGATAVQIKAAWRRLARTHHPDLTGDDPAASRLATQRMAEINDAYAELTRDGAGGARRGGWAGGSEATERGAASTGERVRRGGPPRPKATRPVTGRVDLSHIVRPRNQTIRPSGTDAARGPILRGQPPLRTTTFDREPPRASTPTGPLARSRLRGFRPPAMPALADAAAVEVGFGKFHGHTLGQIAAFEPSYIDWLAATITRDPELVAAARVMREELDRQGIVRRGRGDGGEVRRSAWPMPAGRTPEER
jgi:DnaJ-like protein